ncbi:MAG: alpha/beta hydrolase [Alphaproteobacteria bacterium]|nr:MAG: alpha/beta hydrolase [Alphaproteobacteria bacterium]
MSSSRSFVSRFMATGWARFLLAALALYLLAVAGLTLAQRHLIFLPEPRAFSIEKWRPLPVEVIPVTTPDGLTISSWHVQAEDSARPTIVLFHGNGGNPDGRLDKVTPWLNAGYGVVVAGYRGYGGNPGQPSEEALTADAWLLLDRLAQRGIAGASLILYGESLGTGLAVAMATERSVAALVLESPYTSLADAASHHYPLVPVSWLLWDRFDSLSRIGQIKAPLLILHGEADDVVPVKLGRQLFEAARQPKQGIFLPGLGHNDLLAPETQLMVLDFLKPLPDATR